MFNQKCKNGTIYKGLAFLIFFKMLKTFILDTLAGKNAIKPMVFSLWWISVAFGTRIFNKSAQQCCKTNVFAFFCVLVFNFPLEAFWKLLWVLLWFCWEFFCEFCCEFFVSSFGSSIVSSVCEFFCWVLLYPSQPYII